MCYFREIVTSGFPPQALPLDDLSRPLSSLVKHLDTLTVTKLAAPPITSHSSSISSPPKKAATKKEAKKPAPKKESSLRGGPKVVSLSDYASEESDKRRTHGGAAGEMDLEDMDEDYLPGETEGVEAPAGGPRRSSRKRTIREVGSPVEPPAKKIPKTDSSSPFIITPEGDVKKKPEKKKRPKKIPGKGYRLGDDSGVEIIEEKSTTRKAPQPKPKPVAFTPTPKQADSEEVSFIDSLVGGYLDNISEIDAVATAESALGLGMLEALERMEMFSHSMENNEKLSKMQNAFKVALDLQYEESLATARFRAMLAKTYKIEPFVSTNDQNQPVQKIKVTFPDADDNPREEIYDFYTPHELARLFAYIISTQKEAGKELLRPLKMAKTSPRSFWNVIHHFGDVESGLRAIFPRLDWSYLKSRRRSESEKAKAAREFDKMFEENDVMIIEDREELRDQDYNFGDSAEAEEVESSSEFENDDYGDDEKGKVLEKDNEEQKEEEKNREEREKESNIDANEDKGTDDGIKDVTQSERKEADVIEIDPH